MPTPPSLDQVKTYLGTGSSWTDDQIQAALDAETAAQARVCKIPEDLDPASPQPYPSDLAEAVLRRVAHNLALRNLPLGLQASITDMAVATNQVGGTDAEVKRLERPWKRLVCG